MKYIIEYREYTMRETIEGSEAARRRIRDLILAGETISDVRRRLKSGYSETVLEPFSVWDKLIYNLTH